MAKNRKSKVACARRSKLTYARRFACDVLRATRERKGYVREIFDAERGRAFDDASLSEGDAFHREFSFAEAICMGVTACLGTLDELVDRNLNSPRDVKPRLRDALRISAWEMLFSTREDYAVVCQGVELARHVAPKAAGLANAVLRKMAVDAKDFPWGDAETDVAALARSGGMPLWLTRRFADVHGMEATRGMLDAMLAPAPVYLVEVPGVDHEKACDELMAGLRPHAPKPFESAACDAQGQGLQLELVKPDGPDPHALSSFASDAAAQHVAGFVPLYGNVLEIGSGRGTKTALMQMRSLRERGHGADIHALDVHAFKRDVLRKRLQDLGLPPVKTYTGDGRRLDEVDGLPPFFDAVFVDAPCSGTGTFRRHPEGRWRLTEKDVESLVSLQGELLACAAGRVVRGGTLVYSTCSVLPEENERIVRAFLDSEPGASFTQMLLDDNYKTPVERPAQGEDARRARKAQDMRAIAGLYSWGPSHLELPLCCERDCQYSQPNWYTTCDGSFYSLPAEGGSDGHFAAVFVRES